MKTIFFNNNNNEVMKAHVFLGSSWGFFALSIVSLSSITLILSSIASVFAIINYWKQIKKNKN